MVVVILMYDSLKEIIVRGMPIHFISEYEMMYETKMLGQHIASKILSIIVHVSMNKYEPP
jgi:hypothetical protein